MSTKRTTLNTFFLAFLCLVFCACTNKNTDLFAEKDLVDALHREAIHAVFQTADGYKYEQNYLKAAKAFEESLEQNLSLSEQQYAYNQLTFIYLQMNEDSIAYTWIDRLERTKGPLSKTDSADYYYNIGVWAYHTFKPQMAEVYLQKALTGYQNEDVYGKGHLKTALCMTQLGMCHYEFSRADSTMQLISAAYQIFQSNENLKKFSALCEFAMTYINIVDRSHVVGESRCDSALKILNKLPFYNIELIARCHCMKGYMLRKQGQNERDSTKSSQYFKYAEVCFNKAIVIGQKKPTIRLQEFYRESILNYSWLKDTVSFFKGIEKLEKLLVYQPDRYGQPNRLRGYHYYDKNDLKCKEYYLLTWKQLAKDPLRDTKILLETYHSLAKSYSNLEKFDSALFFLKNYYLVGTKYEASDIDVKSLLKPKFYSEIVCSPAIFTQTGEILFKKYKKYKNLDTLKLAFDAFTLADDMLFPSIKTADDDAIITHQKEVGEEAYAYALEVAYELYKKEKKKLFLDYIFKFCERSKAFLLFRDASVDTLKLKKMPPPAILETLKILDSEVGQLSRQGNLDAKNLMSCKQKLDKIYEDIKIKYPDYYKFKVVQPVPSIESVQNTLARTQGLIHYHLGKDKIHILFISKKTTVCYQIDKDSIFEKNIEMYRGFLSGEGDTKVGATTYAKTAFQIYQKLLDTLTPQLKKLKEVVIIPDKGLHAIPFESLVTQSTDGQNDFRYLPYFIDNIQVTYAPAWKIYQNNHGKMLPRKPLILTMTYGNHVNVKGNLPSSEQETQSVVTEMKGAKVTRLLNDDCRKDNFINLSPQFDILHLSLHAESSLTDKHDNKIYFKIPLHDTLFGFDISKINFKAKLIVLSACNTATGKNESGEGTYSLSRSFLQAGVGNVVASLWNISNSQTASLIPYFYQKLNENGSPSEALHFAKKQYLIKVKGDNIKSNPKYWAALVCFD